jgi:hypothetical protein
MNHQRRMDAGEGGCLLVPPFRWGHLLIHLSLFCRHSGPREMMAVLSYAEMEQIASGINELWYMLSAA